MAVLASNLVENYSGALVNVKDKIGGNRPSKQDIQQINFLLKSGTLRSYLIQQPNVTQIKFQEK